MAEQIGLQAVLDTGNFTRGLGVYTGGIDQMNRATSNFASTAGSQFIGLGQGVLKFGAIAAGVAVGGAAALAGGIVALGAAALGEVAKFERMTLSITNLVAREISGGQMIEQARQARIQLTEKESKELEKLQKNIDNEVNDRDILSAKIQEQKERLRQLTEQYGENGLVVIREREELEGMQLDFTDLNDTISQHGARISELTGKEGQLTTVLEKVRVGQISMSEAMGQAAPRAQELIKWIQILAIQSPFNSEGIQMAFQTALAYGFTTEQAQRLTAAEVDFVAATGRTAQSADLIALALGQIQARGKLSAQELRQLSEQGIGTNRILEDMGFSLDDVTNGLVDTDAFIEAVIKDMEIFTGAAKAQATTFSGLTSSLKEIKDVGLREFFTGTFEAIRPYLSDFVEFLTSAALETGSIRALGDALGKNVAGAFQKISGFIATIRAGGLAVFSKYLGVEGIPLWYELKELIGNITSSLSGLESIIDTNLSGPMSDFTGNIIPLLTQGLNFVNENFEKFKGAIIGIGVALASAAIVASLVKVVGLVTSLTSPIGLILTLSALLGAAWQENWFGIQEKTQAVVDLLSDKLMPILDAFREGGFSAGIQELGNSISEFFTSLSGQGGSMPAFDLSKIFSSENVQATLTTLITSIATFITEQWPVIQESFSAWKAGFWEWLTGPGGALEQAETVLGQVAQGIRDFANSPDTQTKIAEIGQVWGNSIISSIQGLFSDQGKASDVMVTLANSLGEVAKASLGLLVDVGATLAANIFAGIVEGWTGSDIKVWTLNELKGYGNFLLTINWGEVGRGLIDKLIAPIRDKVEEIRNIFSGISENIRTIIEDYNWKELGGSIIQGILEGIENNANMVKSKLISLVSDWIATVGQAIGFGSPAQELVPYGASMIEGLTVGIQAATPAFNKTFVDALKSVFPALTAQGPKFEEMMSNIIKAAMPGLVQAFEAGTLSADDLKKQLLDLAGPALGLAGAELAKFQSKMKRYINFDDLITAIGDARQKILSEATKMAADLASALGQFGQMVLGRWADPLERQIGLLQEFVDGQNEAGEAAANAADKIKKNTETIADNNLKLQELGLTREEQQIKIDEQVEKIAELTDRYGANSTEVRKAQLELERLKLKMVKINNEIADTQSSTTKLEDEIIQLQLAVSGTLDPDQLVKIGNLWIKASEAQDLLNAKLEEQKKLQEEQAKLAQQQADLAFLQSQLSLIDMIRNAGLDPAQIFEGITFGLTASLPDMIAATQQAVQALINQVNQGLQIASPSKVMAKAGRMTMAGLAQGITQSQAMVASSVAATRDMLQQAFVPQSLLAAGPSVQGGAVTNNTYYDFNMNVNTGASPQAVIRQYDVMRGMVGT